MSFNIPAAKASIALEWQKTVIPTLEDYIRIENQSPSWEAYPYTLINNAATRLATWATALNLKNTTVNLIATSESNKRTPLILVVVEASKTSNVHNVLLYGHLDKQPPLTEQWSEPSAGPYVPVIVDDSRYGKVLYGRGGADDALTSIQTLQQQNIPHDRYVVLIEASEESGSPDLDYYVEAYASTIKIPNLIVCLDSGSGNYNQLFLTTSLRGAISGTVRVDIMTSGIHSGVASGIVPETFRIQRNLLDRIEHQDGEFNKDFTVTIPEYRIEETKKLAEVLGPDFYKTEFPWTPGAQPVSTDPVTLLLNKAWRPSLCVIGQDGIPSVAEGGNVLRPFTAFKVSLRLPPTLDAVDADAKLGALMTQKPTPYGSTVTYTGNQPGQGWDSPELASWLSAAVNTASQQFFGGKDYVAQGEGGSIPFMAMLGDKFPEAQFLITGVLGPDSNAHAGNELLNLSYAQHLTGAIAYVLATMAGQTLTVSTGAPKPRRHKVGHQHGHQQQHHH